ncbi:hypothetical protein, partial [Nitrolancea hollandica]|uniref:hypothetical protein n=1 Tax=Nitrolancea hollandica TaxID=1206749 RepID=UPI0005906B83
MAKLLMLVVLILAGLAVSTANPVQADSQGSPPPFGRANGQAPLGPSAFPIDPGFGHGPGARPPREPGQRIVPAPIESVEVIASGSTPTGHALKIVAGLPSGCASPHDSGFRRVGDVINAYVTNTVPANPNTVCSLIYGTYEVTIDLGTDFVPGHEYTARVNDQTITFVAHGGIVPPDQSDERVTVPAPIESAEIVQVPSTSPEYVVKVVAGLPSGCAKPDNSTVTLQENKIRIDVTNTMPAGDPVCTMIYGTYELSINIGSDL